MKSKNTIATALTIAGSDPTGGAGIQADLKTMTTLGVYASAVITSITVQNSRGVSRIEPLSPALVRDQILAVLTDYRVTHIKIGMIGSPEICAMLAGLLADFTGEVILDPVLAASTGQGVAGQDTLRAILNRLMANITVITPNLPELMALVTTMGGKKIGMMATAMEIEQAAAILLRAYPNLACVVVKGGHGQGDQLADYCFHRSGKSQCIKHARIKTRNAHGTGCTTASALTALHLRTGDYEQAFVQTISYLQTLLTLSAPADIVVNADGQGPLLHHLYQAKE